MINSLCTRAINTLSMSMGIVVFVVVLYFAVYGFIIKYETTVDLSTLLWNGAGNKNTLY